MDLRNEISKIIGIDIEKSSLDIEFEILESVEEDDYTRQLIEYDSYGDKVKAYLLLPKVLSKNPAVLINHQQNREHHLGKCEVCPYSYWLGEDF